MGRLIDIENIDYVRLEDSLHCLEYHKGNEVEYMICAPTVEAIPKADYENRLKADMVAMLEELQLKIEEKVNKAWGYPNFEYAKGLKVTSLFIQEKINALKGGGEDDSTQI